MSKHIETGISHKWYKRGTLQGRNAAIVDVIIEEQGGRAEPMFWDIATPGSVGRQKLFACRWRYINGRLMCV